MRLLVYLRDGRTVYRVIGRGLLSKLVNAVPWNEERSGGTVDRGIWNPTTGDYVWSKVRIRSISKTSISVVEEEMTYSRDEVTA